ncbi:MAG: 30S ribosomal protein S1 [Holosporales bacterium]|jgi:small subunit ribosomal protein S1|nr:30S ribosomal protein S1 [Holosporales bacterium]
MKENNKVSFADMLAESLDDTVSLEGKVVSGRIVGIKDDKVIVDVGLKAEGRLSLSDVKALKEDVNVNDTIDVFIEKFEDKHGEPVLSIEKAKREAVWRNIEGHLESGETIEGIIMGRTKGGFAVDINGTAAFLPGSQVDLRLVKDITPLLNIPQPFRVLKTDRSRNNIVVSRRAVLEATRNQERADVISKLSEGMIINGIVKNIMDYGVFVDIGGIDGLLHVTDMSWKRVSNPADIVNVGDAVDVQIIKFNKESGRISLGMKQLMKTPWENIEQRYKVGEKYTGKVMNITDYGVFIELEDCIEGMIYMTELSWVRKNIHPNKIVEVGQIVEVMVLDIIPAKRKISLGLKQCQPNPWEQFAKDHPVGTRITGEVKNITEFGIFVGLTDVLDGMIHMSDVSWTGRNDVTFEKGQQVEVVVLDVKPDKERINLGMRQLSDDQHAVAAGKIKKGDVVVAEVKGVHVAGVDVVLENGLPGFVKKVDISSNRFQQRTDMLSMGEKLEAIVLGVERNGIVNLSVKALEIQREKEALRKYGSIDSGASLGDILGAALKNDTKRD